MKFLLCLILGWLVLAPRGQGYTLDSVNKIATTDGSRTDVQNAINDAAVVDTWKINIPAGTFTWTGALNIAGKGIKLAGQGAGRVIAQSASSLTIGTGSKTLTLKQSGLAINVGDTLELRRVGGIIGVGGTVTGDSPIMVGTVTAYSGISLTVNVTAVNGVGSGTQNTWIVSTPPTTSIIKSFSGDFINVDEDATHSVEIAQIRFTQSSGTGEFIWLKPSSGTKPTLIHDCYFEPDSGIACIYASNNRGVVWNCSFVAQYFNVSGSALHHVANNETASWTSASTMGAADTTGASNFYIEDSDFHGMLACDIDNRGRAVLRYCVFNNSMTGSHGADSSTYGVRHIEFYNSSFMFDNVGSQSLNLNAFHSSRGGTFLITDCTFDDINSPGYWGDKTEIILAIQNVERSAGPNPCWGAGLAGIQYPCPRQIGMGRVTGTGVDGLGRSSDGSDYVGDSEPVYLWNNTLFTPVVGVTGYSPNECTGSDDPALYIVAGRDYFNNNTAKPGYVKYTYPHPLRAALGGGGDVIAPSVPTGLSAGSITSTSATISWSASTDNVAVTGYDVYRAGVFRASTASTSLAESGLTPSTSYTYTVRARDAAGNVSNASSPLTFSTSAAAVNITRSRRSL